MAVNKKMEKTALKSREELIEIVSEISSELELIGMHIELQSDSRTDELVDFLLEQFFPDETIRKSLDIDMGDHYREMLKKRYCANLSLLLISDETGKIIGCRTMEITSAKEIEEELRTLSQLPDKKVETALTFLHHKDHEMDVFRHFNVDVAFHFLNLGIHRDYRQKGLASKMMQAALLFIERSGLEHPCITGDATSNASQKVYEKFDFEVLHKFVYEDYKVNGEVVIKNTGQNKSCIIFVKQL